MIKLSTYYKINKKAIKRNWRQPFIKEKYNYSILKFIASQKEYIEELIERNSLEVDIKIGEIERDLYKTL